MPGAARVSFKSVALSLALLSLLVAALNLYMNLIASYSIPSLQLDLSVDGDVIDGLKRAPHPLMVHRVNAINKIRNGGRQLTTHKTTTAVPRPCPGICPQPGSAQTQAAYMDSLIQQQIAKVSRNSFLVQIGVPLHKATIDFDASSPNLERIWKDVAGFVKPRSIFPVNQSLQEIFLAVQHAKVVRASIPKKGTQLKALLQLQGGEQALFKPQMYSRDASMPHSTPYSGADRHNGEIAAFHISRFLGLERTPIAIGRKVKLKDDILSVADPNLAQTFFVNDSLGSHGVQCFYGQCTYCNASLPACTDTAGYLEGAVILWLPVGFSTLSRIRSPWARTYDDTKVPLWQTDMQYCSAVRRHPFFGKSPIFLDLIDMAVFDFIIGNADRHRLEVFSGTQSMILLLDNGKSFGNAGEEFDEISILTPLFQCCKIRRRLYDALIKLSEENFGEMLNWSLKADPLYPLLTEQHLAAINRRLRKVLVVVSLCLDQHSAATVIMHDTLT